MTIRPRSKSTFAPSQECDFPDTQPVVVDQREERAIPKVRNRREECPNFELGEASRQK